MIAQIFSCLGETIHSAVKKQLAKWNKVEQASQSEDALLFKDLRLTCMPVKG